MTHLKQSLLLFVTLLGMLGVVSCDDYECETFNYVGKTTISLAASTQHSLTFQWTEVDDVTTYKYVFLKGTVETDKDSPLAEGVTTNNALVFEGLEMGETYTLWVTPVSDTDLVSRSFYGTYSTVGVTALSTPNVTYELNSDTHELTFSWMAVDNATDYTWYYTVNDNTVTETTTDLQATINIKGFENGTYFIYVVANSTVEEYTNSEPGYVTFTIGEGDNTGDEEVDNTPIAEHFAGSYTIYSEGMTCYNLSEWADFTETHTTTISVVNDVTIQIKNFFKGLSLTGAIDENSKFIYFSPQKSSKYDWWVYGFDDSFDYQETTPDINAYYEIEDGEYIIYFYNENSDYGYVWAYGYPYTDGYIPYWVGTSVAYPAN